MNKEGDFIEMNEDPLDSVKTIAKFDHRIDYDGKTIFVGDTKKLSDEDIEKLLEPHRVVDNVNSPPHYNQYGIEAIDAIRASMSHEEYCGHLKGTVLKYLWRYRYKGKPVEDLKKAQWYLDKLIEEVKKNQCATS